MNEITVTLSFSNTHTVYKKKSQNFQKISNFQESYVIKQLLHLNLINMRFYGADSPRSILLYSFKCSNYIIMWSCPGNMPKYYPG